MSEKPEPNLEKLLDQAVKKWIKENPEIIKEMIKNEKEKPTQETAKIIEKIIKETPYAICSSCHRPLTQDQTQTGNCPHCGTLDPYTKINTITGTSKTGT